MNAMPIHFDDEAIDRHYRMNVIGGHHMMRAAWPVMAAQGHGRILNIASNGVMGVGRNAPYAAAKAAMLGLGRREAKRQTLATPMRKHRDLRRRDRQHICNRIDVALRVDAQAAPALEVG